MLASRACQWRSLQVLQPNVAATYSTPLRRAAYISKISRLQTAPSRFSSSTLSRIGSNTKDAAENFPWKPDPRRGSLAAKSPSKKTMLAEKGHGTLRKPESPEYHKNRWTELKYAQDPLELAKFVQSRLSHPKGGYEVQVLDLVRLASKKGINCVVSWNHIINHELQKGRLSNAYKIYNEMKKRAQPPDSYTYTILLRGYADHAHERNVLGHALSIYYSMSAPNSKVPPSVIHTNAALTVCVRANNADAMWSVASKIPDGGPDSANAITFTTILNFLRQSAISDGPEEETEEQTVLRRERSIVDGRRIWVDAVGKWRASQLTIDEELVCAMGRLLLVGSRPRDWDDVLSLFAQTMDIPRLLPRLGTAAQDGEHEATLPYPEKEPPAPQEVEESDPEAGTLQGAEFLPLNQKSVGRGRLKPLLYASPGNSTLSLIQGACLKLGAQQESTAYWNLLTDSNTYGIKPDLPNLHMRLRLLRQNRASREAVDLIEHDILGSGQQPTRATFRIAMSTCVRDKNNPNVLNHAGRILEAMTSNLVDTDSKATTMYADLVYNAARSGAEIKDALIKLEPALSSIKIQLGVGKEAHPGTVGAGTWGLSAEERIDAMKSIKMIYRLYERVLLRKEVADEEARPFMEGRARLSSLLNRLEYKTRQKAAALRRTSEDNEDEEGVPSEIGRVDEGDRHKKPRKLGRRHRRADIEVFDAWEKRSTEARDRLISRREEKKSRREPKEYEQSESWEPPWDDKSQWDRFDRLKGRQYRKAKGEFGAASDPLTGWLEPDSDK